MVTVNGNRALTRKILGDR